jgi:hypothetical protein
MNNIDDTIWKTGTSVVTEYKNSFFDGEGQGWAK